MSQGSERSSRLTLHRLVDSVALLVLLALAVTGGLLRWTSPPGRGWLKEIHFFLAEVFLGVMALHALLHWRWISANLLGVRRVGVRRRDP
jgi:hypothetical protein